MLFIFIMAAYLADVTLLHAGNLAHNIAVAEKSSGVTVATVGDTTSVSLANTSFAGHLYTSAFDLGTGKTFSVDLGDHVPNPFLHINCSQAMNIDGNLNIDRGIVAMTAPNMNFLENAQVAIDANASLGLFFGDVGNPVYGPLLNQMIGRGTSSGNDIVIARDASSAVNSSLLAWHGRDGTPAVGLEVFATGADRFFIRKDALPTDFSSMNAQGVVLLKVKPTDTSQGMFVLAEGSDLSHYQGLHHVEKYAVRTDALNNVWLQSEVNGTLDPETDVTVSGLTESTALDSVLTILDTLQGATTQLGPDTQMAPPPAPLVIPQVPAVPAAPAVPGQAPVVPAIPAAQNVSLEIRQMAEAHLMYFPDVSLDQLAVALGNLSSDDRAAHIQAALRSHEALMLRNANNVQAQSNVQVAGVTANVNDNPVFVHDGFWSEAPQYELGGSDHTAMLAGLSPELPSSGAEYFNDTVNFGPYHDIGTPADAHESFDPTVPMGVPIEFVGPQQSTYGGFSPSNPVIVEPVQAGPVGSEQLAYSSSGYDAIGYAPGYEPGYGPAPAPAAEPAMGEAFIDPSYIDSQSANAGSYGYAPMGEGTARQSAAPTQMSFESSASSYVDEGPSDGYAESSLAEGASYNSSSSIMPETKAPELERYTGSDSNHGGYMGYGDAGQPRADVLAPGGYAPQQGPGSYSPGPQFGPAPGYAPQQGPGNYAPQPGAYYSPGPIDPAYAPKEGPGPQQGLMGAASSMLGGLSQAFTGPSGPEPAMEGPRVDGGFYAPEGGGPAQMYGPNPGNYQSGPQYGPAPGYAPQQGPGPQQGLMGAASSMLGGLSQAFTGPSGPEPAMEGPRVDGGFYAPEGGGPAQMYGPNPGNYQSGPQYGPAPGYAPQQGPGPQQGLMGAASSMLGGLSQAFTGPSGPEPAMEGPRVDGGFYAPEGGGPAQMYGPNPGNYQSGPQYGPAPGYAPQPGSYNAQTGQYTGGPSAPSVEGSLSRLGSSLTGAVNRTADNMSASADRQALGAINQGSAALQAADGQIHGALATADGKIVDAGRQVEERKEESKGFFSGLTDRLSESLDAFGKPDESKQYEPGSEAAKVAAQQYSARALPAPRYTPTPVRAPVAYRPIAAPAPMAGPAPAGPPAVTREVVQREGVTRAPKQVRSKAPIERAPTPRFAK